MSNGKGIAIAGLIFGLVGLGLGGYVFYDNTLAPLLGFKSPIVAPEIDEYYVSQNTYQFTNLVLHYIDPMSVVFTATKNSSLYVMFNCYAYITTADTVYVRIYVNDDAKSLYMRASGENIRAPFAIQYYDSSIPAGSYNVSIRGDAGQNTTFFYGLNLYVQTITHS
jgi:hypothetical protein